MFSIFWITSGDKLFGRAINRGVSYRIELSGSHKDSAGSSLTDPARTKGGIATILAETAGFNIILNQKQLIGYAGLDVKVDQSGDKTKKGRISKKGNSHLRKALYMPAISACRNNKTMRLFYSKLNERQQVKKQGVIAVQ